MKQLEKRARASDSIYDFVFHSSGQLLSQIVKSNKHAQ